VCSFAALSAGPVSQAGSLVVIVGGDVAAGAGAGPAVAVVAVVGLEARLGADLGMLMNGNWEDGVGDVQSSEQYGLYGEDDIKRGIGI